MLKRNYNILPVNSIVSLNCITRCKDIPKEIYVTLRHSNEFKKMMKNCATVLIGRYLTIYFNSNFSLYLLLFINIIIIFICLNFKLNTILHIREKLCTF